MSRNALQWALTRQDISNWKWSVWIKCCVIAELLSPATHKHTHTQWLNYCGFLRFSINWIKKLITRTTRKNARNNQKAQQTTPIMLWLHAFCTLAIDEQVIQKKKTTTITTAQQNSLQAADLLLGVYLIGIFARAKTTNAFLLKSIQKCQCHCKLNSNISIIFRLSSERMLLLLLLLPSPPPMVVWKAYIFYWINYMN